MPRLGFNHTIGASAVWVSAAVFGASFALVLLPGFHVLLAVGLALLSRPLLFARRAEQRAADGDEPPALWLVRCCESSQRPR
jgi:hypothetical protein